jgi:PAS domain S-box-containing protein
MAEQLDINFLLERDRHAEALLTLSRRIEGAHTEKDAFDAAFDILRAHTGYRHYWIFVFDEDGRHARFHIGSGGPESDPSTATLTIPGDPMLEEIATSRDIVVVEDARTDPRTNKEIVARIGNRTIINVPIVFNARNLGSVGTGTFGDEGIRLPSPAERDFLKAVASHLAISLDRIHNKSEWQRAEKELQAGEARYRSLVAAMAEGVIFLDAAGVLTAVNPAAERILGVAASALLGKTSLLDGSATDRDGTAIPDDRLPWVLTRVTGAPNADVVLGIEKPDGTQSWISINTQCLDAHGTPQPVVATFRDITEHRRTEIAARRMTRTLITLSAGNEALVRAGSETELLERMCSILVTVGGHRLAWIDLIDQHHADGELHPAASAVADERVQLKPNRTSCGRSVKKAMTDRAPVLILNIDADALCDDCQCDVTGAGCRSGLILPLATSHDLIGALSIYAATPDAFDKAELNLLKELADDLAFGIQAQRTHRAQQHAMARLQRTMESTILALANTLELRDPYTAGHQRRVAQLGKAIALRIGLDAERAEAIYLAGMIHDIGKIYVPAEVLSRPGKLTPLEFSLVKTHVEAAYGILGPIDFSWPLADIVHQHHERLDGSGYPRGIRGDEISIDARIVAVADVVEAMSAHRPYRPGLGIDAALDEITRGKDTLFDAGVVDGCVALFREDSFAFA